MSLLNLKKSKPLAKPNLRTVEDFIDDALLYAQGTGKAKSALIREWIDDHSKKVD